MRFGQIGHFTVLTEAEHRRSGRDATTNAMPYITAAV